MSGKFPLNLSKFKKMSSDQHTTTLQHPAGHMIKIVHSAVSPKMRAQLDQLKVEKPKVSPMARGGKVPHYANGVNPIPSPTPTPDKTGNNSPITVDPNSDVIKSINKAFKFADGGEVEDSSQATTPNMWEQFKDHVAQMQAQHLEEGKKLFGIDEYSQNPVSDEERQSIANKLAMNMAAGSLGNTGKTPAQINADNIAKKLLSQGEGRAAGTVPQVAPVGTGVNQRDMSKAVSIANRPKPYAKGGDVDERDENKKPLEIVPAGAMDDETPLDIKPYDPKEIEPKKMANGGFSVEPASDEEVEPETPLDIQPASNEEISQATPMSGTDQQPDATLSPAPTAPIDNNTNPMQAYQEQLQGLQMQAGAEQQQAKAVQSAAIEARNRAAIANMTYQSSVDDLNDHMDKIRKDIDSTHIDPNDYWKDHSKVASIIGLIIGGFNPTNHSNGVSEMLNQQMEQNLQAQAKNLDSKHNLLAATIRQYGNLRDGYSAARIYQNDMAAYEMQRIAAKTADPMAKARLLEASGQLKASMAPVIQQFNMRQGLMKMQNGQNAAIGDDPSAYVASVVPKEHQKEVFNEIKQAQGAAQNHDEIMQQFDIAAKSPMKSIGVGQGAAANKRMNALFLPMLHDQEGRVNEYEQKTLQDLTPSTGDTDTTLASKRQGLEDFINNKKSAPTAKGFGIDLSKFSTTSTNPITRFSPQQQTEYKVAQKLLQNNPNDSRGHFIMKRLGITR